MSDNTPGAKGAVEVKTKVASFAAFLVSLAGLSWLSSIDTDMIKSLPDWVENPVYAAIAAGIIFLTAFNAKHKPDKLSLSALEAARKSRVNL